MFLFWWDQQLSKINGIKNCTYPESWPAGAGWSVAISSWLLPSASRLTTSLTSSCSLLSPPPICPARPCLRSEGSGCRPSKGTGPSTRSGSTTTSPSRPTLGPASTEAGGFSGRRPGKAFDTFSRSSSLSQFGTGPVDLSSSWCSRPLPTCSPSCWCFSS